MKILKNILKALCFLLLAVVILAVGLFGYLTLTEYKPDDVMPLEAEGDSQAKPAVGESYTLFSWNIGYGALGDNADFFMDGGTMVMTADEARVRQNMSGITEAILAESPDIIFLQEVDLKSSRSHRIDETQLVKTAFPSFTSCFAYNYKTAFVPYPIPPLGHVESGLQTLSRFEVSTAERIQLPCPFKWPSRIANLKRALMVSRTPIEGSDKELVLINLHLEAYDSGEGKIAQARMLREYVEGEVSKGNYVIAGGDFNQTFTTVDLSAYPVLEGMWKPGLIDTGEYSEGWQFLMTNEVPSCRSLDRAYAGASHEDFQYYVIDGLLVSANITVDSFEVQDLDFVCSDHNPTLLHFTLN